MCGICGIINLDSEMTVSKAIIDQMVNQLLHRGPDTAGVWLGRRVGLGHTRLSIIDLSKAADQPMSNEDESIWITYNGEVYNFDELRKKLEVKGHRFKSRSDTEVILHLYEDEGVECVSQLRGMFAFGLWDQDKKKLLLVRDRMGQKPLYYYKDEQKLLFASEIKGILATGLVEGLPDYKALYQYLCLGYVPHPRTGFKGIRKLPPGHRLIVNEANVTLEPYWSLDSDSNEFSILDEREASQRLADLLFEATRIRMISDVPLGILLSGGIDSNSVAAMMSRCAGQIKTFTVGFEDELYDERNEARFFADRLGTDHHEMVIRPDITALLPKLVYAYDEPFADPSAIPSYYVAQMASQYVTVVLTGDGGDENFAGYGEYVQGVMGKWIKNIPERVAVYFSRILDQKRPGKVKSLSQVLALTSGSQARIFGNLRLAVPMILMDSLLNPDYRALVGRLDPASHLVECYQRCDRGDTANAMLAVDQRTFLPDDLLFKIDIATMSHSLEARSPFLDHHLVEFAAGLPGNLKLKGWRKKYILKESLKDILPDQVLKRRKRGFDIPVDRWLREELKEICEDAFASRSLVTELLQKNKLEEMFQDHVARRKEWGRLLWIVLMLHLWSEAFSKGRTIAKR